MMSAIEALQKTNEFYIEHKKQLIDRTIIIIESKINSAALSGQTSFSTDNLWEDFELKGYKLAEETLDSVIEILTSNGYIVTTRNAEITIGWSKQSNTNT